jgi:DNA mismatch repair protein MutS2
MSKRELEVTRVPANQLLDEKTKIQVHWEQIWAQVCPYSSLGIHYKNRLLPFGPHDRLAWQEEINAVKQMRIALEDRDFADTLRKRLQSLRPVEQQLALLVKGMALRVVDFFEIKQFLWTGRGLQESLREKQMMFSWMTDVDWERLLRLLNPSAELTPDFSLDDGYDPRLAQLRNACDEVRAEIRKRRKEQYDVLHARYGRLPNREGEYIWDKNDHNMLALASEDRSLIRQAENAWEVIFRIVDSAVIEKLKEQEHVLMEQLDAVEKEVLQEISRHFLPEVARLRQVHQAFGRLDWLVAKSEWANRWEAVEPKWNERGWLIEDAVHPWIKKHVCDKGGRYTPLSLTFQRGVGVVTGPNMGGKSVALKTMALLQGLAQYAFHVPVRAYSFRPVERIRFLGGDEQTSEHGLSSFGGEVKRLADILGETGEGLLLMDEVARTTNPQEGEAIAVGLVRHLLTTEHSAFVATHFPAVAKVPGIQAYRVIGLEHEKKEEIRQHQAGDMLVQLQQAMDYRIVPLRTEREQVPQDALWIAEHLGLPKAIIHYGRIHLEEQLDLHAAESTPADR